MRQFYMLGYGVTTGPVQKAPHAMIRAFLRRTSVLKKPLIAERAPNR